MKSFTSQSLALALLIGIAFLANHVAAGNPASNPSATFPNGNTAFPITTGSYDQIKGAGAPPAPGGGLVIGKGFLASKNASFDKTVGIQGVLLGNPTLGCNGSATSPVVNSLCFGSDSYPVVINGQNETRNNEVIVTTSGWTYVQAQGGTMGTLHTPVEKAPPGKLMPLCANKVGEIIVCPGALPITP